MTKKRLLLFDIDGTLVNTAGAGVESLKRTLHNRFGAKDDLHDIEIAGKTDRAIIRDILRKYQVDPKEENIASFAQEYIHGLPLSLSRSRGRVLPGIQRSGEHTSELQSPYDLVCRLLLEKKKKTNK